MLDSGHLSPTKIVVLPAKMMMWENKKDNWVFDHRTWGLTSELGD
jgi:hypothetical protein